MTVRMSTVISVDVNGSNNQLSAIIQQLQGDVQRFTVYIYFVSICVFCDILNCQLYFNILFVKF